MVPSTTRSEPLGEESVRSFARWIDAVEQVLAEPRAATGGRAPQATGRALPGENASLAGALDDPAEEAVDATLDGVLAELRDRLQELAKRTAAGIIEAVPASDPQRVRDLSPAILRRYQVRQGHAELSGCSLEPRPFLRLTFGEGVGQPDLVRHLWFADDGQPVEPTLLRRLHFDRLDPVKPRLREGDAANIDRWIAAAWAGSEEETTSVRDTLPRQRLISATLGWCRRASGKVAIVFEAGPTAEIPFDGWAADFASGETRPAPFRCPRTGLESDQVIALDDGTVTVPAATDRCAQTGKEVFAETLARCELTGKRVLPECLIRGAVTGRRLLADAAAECQWCQRLVVPGELAAGLCRDCRQRQPVDVPDPLLEKLRKACPEMARFRRWTGWRDGQVGVFVGRRGFREGLLVADVATGTIRRVGRRWRLGGRWQLTPP